MCAANLHPSSGGAKAEIFDLHHRDYWLIIVGLQKINGIRLDARRTPQIVLIHRPATSILIRVILIGIVALSGRSHPCE
jgi:hypothetical protein